MKLTKTILVSLSIVATVDNSGLVEIYPKFTDLDVKIRWLYMLFLSAFSVVAANWAGALPHSVHFCIEHLYTLIHTYQIKLNKELSVVGMDMCFKSCPPNQKFGTCEEYDFSRNLAHYYYLTLLPVLCTKTFFGLGDYKFIPERLFYSLRYMSVY